MSIASGQDADPADFINESEADPTPALDAGRVPKLESDGKLSPFFLKTVPFIRRIYKYTEVGSTNTRFDITNPSGTTFRYTWDGTGTNPNINASTFPVGAQVNIFASSSSGIHNSNRGYFVVTGSGSDYFEVTNASGVVESDKTLANGFLRVNKDVVWTKPSGLKYVEVEVCGGGGGGAGSSGQYEGGSGGGGGGYSIKQIPVASLGSTETISVGAGGKATENTSGGTGGTSSFGSHLSATGGTGGVDADSAGSGGVGSNGDLNLYGGCGIIAERSYTGSHSSYGGGEGGSSKFAGSVQGVGYQSSGPGTNGNMYGGGGSGSANDNNYTGNAGGAGGAGIIIVNEYYI